jgi:hypothetical protein
LFELSTRAPWNLAIFASTFFVSQTFYGVRKLCSTGRKWSHRWMAQRSISADRTRMVLLMNADEIWEVGSQLRATRQSHSSVSMMNKRFKRFGNQISQVTVCGSGMKFGLVPRQPPIIPFPTHAIIETAAFSTETQSKFDVGPNCCAVGSSTS